MDELKRVILEAPKEKAPRPDGFIGVFFSSCWEVIKEDLIKVVHHFFIQNQQGLNLLNQAFIVLVTKKSHPQRVTDYRPISLTHSFSKIISNFLANRLGLELEHLVSYN
jgi:hypothetical protein